MKKSPNQIRRLFTLCMLMMFFGSINTFAQEISGKVTDEAKEPIPGATIMVEGNSDVGTITDMDGNFILNVPDASSNSIIVSFIGMEAQTIAVAGKSVINVVLSESFTSLDEVVAIGYGSVKKKDLSGAVASIDNEKLKENPVSNVTEAMQGKLAGVSISTSDGRPGADVKVRIRGGGSITQANDPLIVVDGVPGGTLSDIPANQIESIDVLKDASSTAIYGARGANGVILVTTKGLNTKEGTTRVSYSGFYQMKQLAKTNETLSAQDYILHQWSYATAYAGNAKAGVEGYFGLGSENGNNYAAYANQTAHNYTDDLIRDSYQQDHNLSIAKSTENSIFSFNANYNDDLGIKLKSGYKRYQFNMRVQQNLAKNFKIGFDTRYTQTRNEGRESVRSGRGSILSSAYMFNPIDNPLGEGDFSDYDGWGNGDVNLDPTYDPYKRNEDIFDITNRQKFNINAYMVWDITDGLTFRWDLTGNRNYSQAQYYDNGLSPVEKEARLSTSRGSGWRSAPTISYEVQGLSQHSLKFLVGNEALYSQTDNTRLYGRAYPEWYGFDEAMAMIQDAQYYKEVVIDEESGATIHEITKNNFDFSNNIGVANTTLSYFGRVNYAFKDRYIFQASIRADGSSKFAPENRWGYFPAASAAWRVSDEPFMDGSGNWLDNLKLRLAYGESGNDRIPYYAWNDLFDVSYLPDGTKQTVTKGVFPNEDLIWETTVSRNIGVDFNVFNNKVGLVVDLYSNYTKDLLGGVELQAETGYKQQFRNIGKTSNKGVEVGLNYDIVRNQDFTFSVSGTYNYNINTVEELNDPRFLSTYTSSWNGNQIKPENEFSFEVGKPVGLISAFVSDGFYTPDDFTYTVDEATGEYSYVLKEGVPYYSTILVNNYPNPFRGNVFRAEYDEDGNPTGEMVELNDIFPGAVKMKDVDGDGTINDDDVAEIGQMSPKHTGGFALNATYKGFDFNASFAYALGGKVLNVNKALNTFGNKDNTLGANRLSYNNNSYKVYDVNNDGNLVAVTDPDALNTLNANADLYLPYYELGVLMSDFIEDADYLRLNALTLGYTLPKDLTQKISIERLRVYITGGNLFVLTNYSGLDPEVNTQENRGAYPTPGLDYGSYPRSRTITFGVNVDF